MNAPFARLTVAAVSVVSATALLAGCGSSGDAASTTTAGTAGETATSTCPTAEPAADAKTIDLTGATGKATVIAGTATTAPKVTVDGEYRVDKTSTVVAHEGTGAVVTEHSVVTVCYRGVNGRTGETFDDSFARGTSVEFALPEVIAGFSAALVGQKVGASVVTSVTSADGYAQGQPAAKINRGDTLIFAITLLAAE